MGNLFGSSKSRTCKYGSNSQCVYEPFLNGQTMTTSTNQITLEVKELQEIKELQDKNRALEDELKIIKRELLKHQERQDKLDATIQIKYQELLGANNDNKDKINIITKDMENLLNNDKILLDKLIEKNIVSTIQEEDEEDDEDEEGEYKKDSEYDDVNEYE